MMDKKITFKHYKPIVYISIICVFSFVATAILVFSYLKFPQIKSLIFIFPLLYLLVHYFVAKRFKDTTGSFDLKKDRVEISSLNLQEDVYYADIHSIVKEYYEHAFIVGSRYNPGQYRIQLKNKKNYIFCIAHSEEKAYAKAIRKLTKNIYKTNRLGVHFNTAKFRDRMSDKQKEKMFEKNKPVCNYSLEKAINMLLLKSNIELIDLTDIDPRELSFSHKKSDISR